MTQEIDAASEGAGLIDLQHRLDIRWDHTRDRCPVLIVDEAVEQRTERGLHRRSWAYQLLDLVAGSGARRIEQYVEALNAAARDVRHIGARHGSCPIRRTGDPTQTRNAVMADGRSLSREHEAWR